MVGIVDEIDGLGAMADAVAPKLSFGKFWNPLRRRLRKIARNCDSLLKCDVYCGILNIEAILEWLASSVEKMI